MWRRSIVLVVFACAVGILVAAPAAVAASPQQIYRDYADNGKLDRSYSKADLKTALKYSAAQGYPRVGVQGAVQQALGAQAVKTTGGLPFTGLDLALMAVGGVLLVGAGTTLRKLGHSRQQQ
jgi:hypothetical protein